MNNDEWNAAQRATTAACVRQRRPGEYGSEEAGKAVEFPPVRPVLVLLDGVPTLIDANQEADLRRDWELGMARRAEEAMAAVRGGPVVDVNAEVGT